MKNENQQEKLANDAASEQAFFEALNAYPEIKARFRKLLDIVNNKNGEINLADKAEEQIIHELRGLRLELLQDWANTTNVAGLKKPKKAKT